MLEATSPKLMGASVLRQEDPRFLTGRAHYVDDLVRPGMLHLSFVRSMMAHADLTSVDVSAARAMDGVYAVMTGAEIGQRTKPIVADSLNPSWQSSDYPIMAADRVRFAGEPIAAVVAEDRYVAEDAGELVEVDYAPRPVVASVADAVAAGAPQVHDHWDDNFYVRRHISVGDLDAAFADAHGVLELDLTSHRSTGVPLEGRGCIAEYDAMDGRLTFWTASQTPHLVRTGLADSLQLPEHRIRVIAPDVGGGFGIKGHLFAEEVAVCVLAMETGRPVKWIEDRQEHLMACIHAREHYHHLEVAYAEDGTLLGLRAKLYIDCGAYSVWPWT